MPSELLRRIKLLALEPSPTAKLISELVFTQAQVLALGETRFIRIFCWKQFMKFQNGKFKISRLKCLAKKENLLSFLNSLRYV